MTIASASNSYIIQGEEASYGTTATAAQHLRFTSEGLGFVAESVNSEEIRSDRNITDNVRTAIGVEGNIDFELSYGTFDNFMEGVFQNDFDAVSGELVNGTTLKSYTIEKGFSTQASGVANEFFVFEGCVPGMMSLSMATGSIITGSFDILGKNQSTYSGAANAGFNGAVTPSAATTSDVMNVISMLTLSEGGSSIGNVQSMELTFDNTLRQQRIIGSTELAGIGSGQFMASGTLTAYFDSMALYNKFLNETASSIQAVVNDGSNSYTIDLPNIKYTTASVLAGGVDEDVVVSLEFMGLYDSGTAGTAKITRA